MHANVGLTRRGFLAVSSFAGAGLILNVAWLNPARGDDSAGSKETLANALTLMRTRGRPGIVIVVPADPTQRATLGKQIAALFPATSAHGSPPAAAAVLLEAVWVCATAKDVGAQPGEALVLLNPDGKRAEGAQADFSKPESVHAAAEKLLAAGRATRAKAERKNPKLVAALAALDNEATCWDGQAVLNAELATCTSAIVHAYRSKPSASAQQVLGNVLNRTYWNRLQGATEFPYGARIEVELDEPEPCPPCGMASPSIRARKFLGFFSG